MTLAELLPALQGLNHAEKLQAMQVLLRELAREEGVLLADTEYPVWTPLDAHEAGSTLQKFLDDHASKG